MAYSSKGPIPLSKINNSNNKHTFLDFVMNWMIIAHPEAQKYQSLQTTEGRSRGEVLEDLTSNLWEWMILMILILLPLISSRIQVIPIWVHNLSKAFRPNMATIHVLSLDTKFIPKWRDPNLKNTFKKFENSIPNQRFWKCRNKSSSWKNQKIYSRQKFK